MGIGTVLLQRGMISRAQLEEALAEQRASGERLDRVLVRLGHVTREQVLQAIGEQFHMPVVDIAAMTVEPKILQRLPARLVYRQNCVPIAVENGTLTVATSDPFELTVLDELKLLAGCSIDLVLADEDDLHKFIRENYGVGGDTLDEMADQNAGVEVQDAAVADEVEQAQEATVIRLVNDLIIEGISDRATDIHIEPYEHELLVRYRIDGVLQKANVSATINRFGRAIVSRLKIMANLNIAEKRKPQDGRITFKHRSDRGLQEFDLRVSIIPMLFGEGVVLRVLNKTAALMSLDDLGMPAPVMTRWDDLINLPHGILLVTGPTGSGKSTTLYASLNRIISDEVKILTVEDPVEYHLSGVNQIQVNTKVGLSFAAGLRSILRHDPDVVMVGEIRDAETAETAIQASLTGHVVLSTLHTNDSPGAVTRLLDMGVEPFLVASSIEGILAQRLVRRICQNCAQPYTPDAADIPPGFDLKPGQTLVRGQGCRACRNTGYRGRLGIFELLTINDSIREMVMQRVNAPVIAQRAREEEQLIRLIEDGYAKARAGVTTTSEVLRALKA
jgi:general secretion pathway protein E